MFTGLSAFPLTPANESGIDEDAFVAIVRRLVEAKVDSIAALGSTGSYAYFTREERARVTRLAVEAADGIPVMVGIGSVRTRDVVALAQDAQEAGAQAGLLAAVSYQPLSEDEVFGLFADVTQACDLPLCVYDNPNTTHFTFSDELHARVAQLPNIAAIKISSVDTPRVARLRALVPGHVKIGVAGDEFAKRGLEAGADVWFSVIGGLLPELARSILAGEAHEALFALFRKYGSVRVIGALAARLGLTKPENLVRPLLPIPAGEVEAVLG